MEHYNNVRLNSGTGYIAPKDVLAGRQQEIHTERDRKLVAASKPREERSGKRPAMSDSRISSGLLTTRELKAGYYSRQRLEPAPSGGCSAWVDGHGRAMSGCYLPVLNPLLPNAVRLLDEFAARAMPVLNNSDNPRVEFSFGVIHVG